ncbi:MAG: hypothetical protein LBF26_02110 [Puniceicoccales bacterium]|nr:hypothetical protein [Puniceicoccales bacterium]
MNKKIVRAAPQSGDASANFNASLLPGDESSWLGVPTPPGKLGVARTLRCNSGWIRLWNAPYAFRPMVLMVLSAIFKRKAEIEEENDKNRWPVDELRREEIPVQVQDSGGLNFISVNIALNMLRRK